MAARAAAQPQDTVGEDPASHEGDDVVLDDARQFGTGAGLGVRHEVGRVLLHEAIRRGLLGTVAFAVERGAIGSPLELRCSLRDGLPVGCVFTD